jgi:S1-C subfamily serine protease
MKKITYTDDEGTEVELNPRKKTGLIAVLAIIILIILGGAIGGAGAVYLLERNGKDITLPSINTSSKQKIVIEESSAFIDVAKKVKPSVVSITTTQSVQDLFGSVYEQKGGGTGFIITSDGLIVTNKHVADAGNTFTVFTSDGQSYPAEVKAKDPSNDLAILKIDAKGLPVATMGDSSKLQVGQWVIAIGNALGEYQNTVTAGVVSAQNRSLTAQGSDGSSERLEGLIQTDTAINSGNSGGPLVNLAGEVIGINTAVADKSFAEGIGFAIPINTVQSAIDSVKSTGKITRPYLGVNFLTITKDIATSAGLQIDHGALVYRGTGLGAVAVVPGSPADKAGIAENDIITAINNDQLTESFSLRTAIAQYKPGDEIEIVYQHKGEEKKVKAKLEETKNN